MNVKMKLFVLLMMTAIMTTIVQGSLVHNFTFDGGYYDCGQHGFYQWNSGGGNATCNNNDFRWDAGVIAEYANNLSLPWDQDIEIIHEVTFSGTQRRHDMFFVNKSTGTNSISESKVLIDFNAQSDVIIIYEDGVAKPTCAHTMNAATYTFRTELFANGTINVYQPESTLRCTRQLNNSIESNNEYFGVTSYSGVTAFTPVDDIAISYTNPILYSINADVINNSNITDTNLTINYNATYADTTDIFNCTFDVNTVLNQTDLDVDLSTNQDFFIDFGEVTDTYTLEIECENADVSGSSGVYTVNVDSIPPAPPAPAPDYAEIPAATVIILNLFGLIVTTIVAVGMLTVAAKNMKIGKYDEAFGWAIAGIIAVTIIVYFIQAVV